MPLTKIDWDNVQLIRGKIDGQAEVIRDCKQAMGKAQTEMAAANNKMHAYKEQLHSALFPEGDL